MILAYDSIRDRFAIHGLTGDQTSLIIWAVQFGRRCYQLLRRLGAALGTVDQ